jgi:hypothetical protein
MKTYTSLHDFLTQKGEDTLGEINASYHIKQNPCMLALF